MSVEILSRDMIAGVEIKNGSHDSDHAPFKGDLSSVGWHFDIAYLYTQELIRR